MESQRNRNGRPTVAYLLFQYQSELTHRKSEPTRHLVRTKIHLIDGLVSSTMRHGDCSVKDLQDCNRELDYKEHLCDQLKNMRRRRRSSSAARSLSKERKSNSTGAASVSVLSAAPPKAAPGTPPKPQRKINNKMTIYGPEIFV